MSTVVVNCYHWIGFHFVQKLLERGEEVIGFHKELSEKELFLSMFFGRNHSFTHVKEIPDICEKIIVIGKAGKIPAASVTIQCIPYAESEQRNTSNNHVTIYMPMVFGEWMPMNSEGVLVDNERIPFHSQIFTNEAIYIKDFINCCLPLLDGASSSSPLHIKAKDTKEDKELILENEVYFRDNGKKKETIKKVQQHYVDYAAVYYE